MTKYSWLKLLKLSFDGIFSLSVKPLSVVFWLGLASSVGAMLAFFGYLLWHLTGIEIFGHSPSDVPGFTSVILALFLLSGIQLVSIGLIGEYVGRIYNETKNRPTFVARPVKRRGERAEPERPKPAARRVRRYEDPR